MFGIIDQTIIEAAVVVVTTVITSLIVVFRSKKFKELKSTVDYQLSNNGGGSLVDKVDKLATKLDEVATGIQRLDIWKSAWMELYDNPVFISNALGNCVWVNNEYLKTVGATFQDVEGQGWNRIIHPEDRAKVKEDWKLAVETAATFQSSYRVVNLQTSSVHSVHCKSKPLIKDAHLVGYIGVWDVSST